MRRPALDRFRLAAAVLVAVIGKILLKVKVI